MLAKPISVPETEAEKATLSEWFNIAHNWRRSHIPPMEGIRAELRPRAKRQDPQAIVVARLKRMASIRKKLRSRSLPQIQDVGGCRAILSAIEDVVAVRDSYRSGRTRHELTAEDDYVGEPKAGGYRSSHLVLKFRGQGARAAYDGLRIEIQLRTRLQHAWATAVEAVGLYRSEDLKGGKGDARWLRFFELMSSEIAAAERLPLVPLTSHVAKERRQELQELNAALDGFGTLEGFRRVVRETEHYQTLSRFYLIRYDNRARTVSVRPYDSMVSGSGALDREEEKTDSQDAVLVEVDKIEDLREAYPNYFLDVSIFSEGLRSVLRGSGFTAPNLGATARSRSRDDLATILKNWPKRRGG